MVSIFSYSYFHYFIYIYMYVYIYVSLFTGKCVATLCPVKTYNCPTSNKCCKNSQILELSVFVLLHFLLRKLLRSSFSFLFFNHSFLSSSVSKALCCRNLNAFAETDLPCLKQTTFFRKQFSLFSCSPQCIARSFTQTLHLGKGSGYVVNH